MNQRGFGADLVDHDLLDLQHIAGTLAVWLSGLIDHMLHATGNASPLGSGSDAFLGQHDDRGFVDAVQPGELAFVGAALERRLVHRRTDLARLLSAFGSGAARQFGSVGRQGAG